MEKEKRIKLSTKKTRNSSFSKILAIQHLDETHNGYALKILLKDKKSVNYINMTSKKISKIFSEIRKIHNFKSLDFTYQYPILFDINELTNFEIEEDTIMAEIDIEIFYNHFYFKNSEKDFLFLTMEDIRGSMKTLSEGHPELNLLFSLK